MLSPDEFIKGYICEMFVLSIVLISENKFTVVWLFTLVVNKVNLLEVFY